MTIGMLSNQHQIICVLNVSDYTIIRIFKYLKQNILSVHFLDNGRMLIPVID